MTEFLMQYYGEHLRFSFGEAEKQGLEHFAHLCVRHGVLPSRDWYVYACLERGIAVP